MTNSWVDLRHRYNICAWTTLTTEDYRHFFRRFLTSFSRIQRYSSYLLRVTGGDACDGWSSAGMTKLRDLCIKSATWFPKDQCHGRDEKKWQSPHSPSLVRAIFLALTKFQFKGDREYLADLMAPIDAPRLEDLSIKYPKPHENYEEEKTKAGNLSQFISRTETFKHAQFRCAELTFDRGITYAKTDLPQGECQQALFSLLVFDVGVPCDTVSDMIHVLGLLSVMLSDVQHLSIKDTGSEDEGEYESILESADLGAAWPLLLRSVPVVDVLHVSWKSEG